MKPPFMKKHRKLQNRLSLRTETVKALRTDQLGGAAGAGLGASWTCTLFASCAQICATQECTILPPCGGHGGGGGSLSGVRCPQ
ncbi:MAG: hypothetical protein K8W52_41745 [Deltaproteobacteria bacterium]|nr:hypothetical protein [Deltaproteobacteria bacterium]